VTSFPFRAWPEPVFTTGITLAPRSLGAMFAMLLVSWLANRTDQSKIVAARLTVLGFGLHEMSH
jgi:hypothetical protein